MKKTRKFGADPREEPVTGGRNTPMTPERRDVLERAAAGNSRAREAAKRTPVPKYAEGGIAANPDPESRRLMEANLAAVRRREAEDMAARKKPAAKAVKPKPKSEPKPASKSETKVETARSAPAKKSGAQQVRENIGKPVNSAADTAKFDRMMADRAKERASRGRGSGRASGTVGTSNINPSGNARQMLRNLGLNFKSGGTAKKESEMKGRKTNTMKKYASGGSVSSRADGVAKKGKTHTKMVKMAMGGKAKKDC